MATTVVYPSLDVSGTGSISTLISTAGTFAGSLTASALTVTGTATFSGTAVFVGTAQFLATTTFSGTAVFLTSVVISGTLSVGTLVVAGVSTLSGVVNCLTTLRVSATASIGGLLINNLPAQHVRLANTSLGNNALSYITSGSWSDFKAFHIFGYTSVETILSGTLSVALYTDGGTTPMLTLNVSGTNFTQSTATKFYFDIWVEDAAGTKMITLAGKNVGAATVAPAHVGTSTANTGIINAFRFTTGNAGASATMTGGIIAVYGIS